MIELIANNKIKQNDRINSKQENKNKLKLPFKIKLNYIFNLLTQCTSTHIIIKTLLISNKFRNISRNKPLINNY